MMVSLAGRNGNNGQRVASDLGHPAPHLLEEGLA